MDAAATVEARIAHILSTSLHLDIPSVEMDLFKAGALDSLAFVEFLLHLEREFGIMVSVEDLELDHFRTIRRIAQFVIARNGQTPAAAWSEGTEPPGRAG
ncbi:MAG TPA: acyl carrier protein [Candidatus Dormibacteraeota bacterium]|nr:acyl carrier protein [Candidatus Dormibacteraeota bacterium]